ncbi:MAG: MafI family immunity protein [Dehalococcoidia bacterium]
MAEQLPAKTTGMIDELIDHNECGVAVEMLSEAVVEAEASIAPETLTSVEELVTTMGLDRDVAERLRPFVETATERADG